MKSIAARPLLGGHGAAVPGQSADPEQCGGDVLTG